MDTIINITGWLFKRIVLNSLYLWLSVYYYVEVGTEAFKTLCLNIHNREQKYLYTY